MSDAKQAVIERNRERCDALLAHDVERVRATLSADLVFIHTSGKRETRSEFLERLGSGELRYRRIAESDVTVDLVGELAVLVSRVAQVVTLGDADRTLESVTLSLWEQRGGQWVMRTYQATPALPVHFAPLAKAGASDEQGNTAGAAGADAVQPAAGVGRH